MLGFLPLLLHLINQIVFFTILFLFFLFLNTVSVPPVLTEYSYFLYKKTISIFFMCDLLCKLKVGQHYYNRFFMNYYKVGLHSYIPNDLQYYQLTCCGLLVFYSIIKIFCLFTKVVFHYFLQFCCFKNLIASFVLFISASYASVISLLLALSV